MINKENKDDKMSMIKIMKKWMILVPLMILMVQAGNADWFTLGLNGGYRHLNDPNLGEIYGDGYVFEPYVRYSVPRLLTLELAYEGGYKKNGPVGLFQEDSTLNVSGFQLAAVVPVPILRIRRVSTYFKVGIAYYFYKQDIDSEFIRQQVDHTKWTTVIGVGMSFHLFRGLFLTFEYKSIPLRVKPFDINVDLGGSRIIFGLGYQFWL
jgi:opacity protein-like surface antigen